ncbi:MAG: polysaccharide biosynthesis C-terminal domain-containing protein, partial [bacterium]|nr:polysaccharide biosynthesis C-terminal domain-containing protein [bacterium]
PALIRLEDTKEKYQRIIIKPTHALMALALPLVAGGVILAYPIIKLIFGSQYLDSIPAFKIVLFLIPISYAWNILTVALFVKNLQKNNMIYAAIAAGINILLNLILIPAFGLTGAALATIISQFAGFSLALGLFKKIADVSLVDLRELKKLGLATLVMVLFLLIPPIKNSALWINIPLAGLVYLFSIYLLKPTAARECLSFYKSSISTSEKNAE